LGEDETNLEVAIDEWAKHKRNIGVWSNSFTQLQELVDKGEMWLGPQWGGFTVAAQRNGLNIDFAWPEEGATQQSIIVHVNEGWDPEIQEVAEQFGNVWLDPEVQLAFLTEAGLSPTNTTVEIPDEFMDYDGVITPERLEEKTLMAYDYGYVGENLSELTQMINEKLK
jgi:spermidine/putrescine-binding protein